MPAELLLNYMRQNSQWRQLQFQVVFQCAPVLKGVKASNIITLPKGMWQTLKDELRGTSLNWIVLTSGRRKDVILLYREKWLRHILAREENEAFIRSFGYEDMSLAQTLVRLSVRYSDFSTGKGDFPHELGVFLQYPLKDVKSFIEHGGKHSLMNGYWKVYHDPGKAQRIFRIYDRVRERAAMEFMNGRTPEEIAV